MRLARVGQSDLVHGRHGGAWTRPGIGVFLLALAVFAVRLETARAQDPCFCPSDVQAAALWNRGTGGPDWNCLCTDQYPDCPATGIVATTGTGSQNITIVAQGTEPGGCQYGGRDSAMLWLNDADCDRETEWFDYPWDPETCLHRSGPADGGISKVTITVDPEDKYVGTDTVRPEAPIRIQMGVWVDTEDVVHPIYVLPASYMGENLRFPLIVWAVGPLEDVKKVVIKAEVTLVYTNNSCLSCWWADIYPPLEGGTGDSSTFINQLTVTVVPPTNDGDCTSGACGGKGGNSFGGTEELQPSGASVGVVQAGAARFSTGLDGPRTGDARLIGEVGGFEVSIPPRRPILAYGGNLDFSISESHTEDEWPDQVDYVTVTDNMSGDLYHFASPSYNVVLSPRPVYDAFALSTRERYDGSGQLQEWMRSSTAGGTVEYTYDPNLSGATIWYEYEQHENPTWSELTKVKVGLVSSKVDVLDLGYASTGRLTHLSGACPSCGAGEYDYAYDAQLNLTLVTEGVNGNTTARKDYDYGLGTPSVTKLSAGPTSGGIDRWRYDYSYNYNSKTYNNLALTKYTYERNDASRIQIEEYATQAVGSPTRVFAYGDVSTSANPVNLATGVRYATVYGMDAGTYPTKYFTVSPRGITKASYHRGTTGDPSFGRVTKETLEGEGRSITTAEYTYVSVSYDGFDMTHRSSMTDARGGVTYYDYAPKGLLTKQVMPETNAGRLTTEYRYDPRRRITREWSGAAGAGSVTRAYEYDNADNLTKTIEAFGSTTVSPATTFYAYSLRNFQTKVRNPGGFWQEKFYTVSGAVTSEVAYADASVEISPPDPGSDQVISQVNYEYDDTGHVTTKRVANMSAPFLKDAGSIAWIDNIYQYDYYGRRTAVIVDAGTGRLNLTTHYEYNNQDEVTKTTTPGGVWTETQRDGRGLVVKQIMGYDAEPTHQLTTGYEYDEDGNLTQTTPPSGSATVYQYDGFDRRTKTIRG